MDRSSHSLDPSTDGSLDVLDASLAGALRRLAAAPEIEPMLAPGSRIGERYEIEDRLGRGGMGVVYRARDHELDRTVAIKFHAALADPRAADRMLREARSMARLTHPNVVTVHEVGRLGDRLFIAMEWVDGVDLRRWLGERERGPEPILALFLAAGAGLAAAHRVGLVHRDFKPSNVLVGVDGQVRVADFGLATATEGSAGASTPTLDATSSESTLVGDSTRTRRAIGTPAYMAPEQASGLVVDARADQYSFCVALYEALSGALPGPASGPGGRPLPARLARPLARGLSPRPEDRFPDIDALLDALRPELARRRRRRWIVGATIVCVGVVGVGLGAQLSRAAAPVSCEVSAWAASAIWPEERRESLERRLSALEDPYASELWPRLLPLLGGYAEQLSTAAQEACRDTHERGVHSPERLDRRMTCLARARRELDARLGELDRLDAGSLTRALPLATGLPTIEECADPLRLEGDPPEEDPARARRIEALEGALADARARLIAGDLEGARAQAAALTDEVETLALPRLAIDQHRLLGDALAKEQLSQEARTELEAGYLQARAVGDDERAGQLAASLAQLFVVELAEPREGLFWAKIARAELDRVGGDYDRSVQLLVIEGYAHDGLGDLAASIERYDRALAMIEVRPTSRPDMRAVLLSHRGIARERSGRLKEALADQEEALAIARVTLGEHHPNVLYAEDLVGSALVADGRYDEARPHYEAALRLATARGGDDPPLAEIPLLNLAVLRGDLGEYRGAIELLGRVRAIHARVADRNPETVATALEMLGEYRARIGEVDVGLGLLAEARAILVDAYDDGHPRVASLMARRAEVLALAGDLDRALAEGLAAADALGRIHGPDHPTLLDALTAAAIVQRRLGDLEAAESTIRRVVAGWSRTSPDHPHGAHAAMILGALLVDRGRTGEATPLLEAALQAAESRPPRPSTVVMLRWHLARALQGGGGDRARACELAAAASEAIATQPDLVEADERAALTRGLEGCAGAFTQAASDRRAGGRRGAP